MIQSPPCAQPCWREGKEEPFGKSQLQAVERTIKDFCLRRVADICSVLGPRAVEMSQTPARPRGSSESGNSLTDRALPLGDAWWVGGGSRTHHAARELGRKVRGSEAGEGGGQDSSRGKRAGEVRKPECTDGVLGQSKRRGAHPLAREPEPD